MLRESQDLWVHLVKMAAQDHLVPLEAEVLQGLWDHLDQRASTETLESQVNKDQLVWQGKGVLLERMVRSALQDLLDQRVLLVKEENKDPLE